MPERDGLTEKTDGLGKNKYSNLLSSLGLQF